MMSQQFHQPEPPNKVKTFMKDIGWPFIILTVGTALATVIATVIVTVWIGKTQILNFNWLILVLALALIVITASFAWYNVRTRRILQKKYQEDIDTMKKDLVAFKDEYRQLVQQEIGRSNGWKISYSLKNAQEQTERLEEVRKEYLEAINDVKTSLTSGMANNQTLWQQWITSHANAHRWEQESYKQQLEALEKTLTEKQSSEIGN